MTLKCSGLVNSMEYLLTVVSKHTYLALVFGELILYRSVTWVGSAHAWSRTSCPGGLDVSVRRMLCCLFGGRRCRLWKPSMCEPAKRFNTKSKRLTLSFRVTLGLVWKGWSIKSTDNNNYRERQTYTQCSQVSGLLLNRWVPAICTVPALHPIGTALVLRRTCVRFTETQIMCLTDVNSIRSFAMFVIVYVQKLYLVFLVCGTISRLRPWLHQL
jgi:hypothetical protein